MGIAVNALIATTKQVAEAANLEVFKNAHPNFAGRPLISVQWGGDPPDVLCLDAHGIRIGVELVQWVNGQQMAASKAQYDVEESYNVVIQSESVQQPADIGMIFIYAKISLAAKNTATFRKEIYDCIAQVAARYPEWGNPQGYVFTDFTGYPCLAAHLEAWISIQHVGVPTLN